jgi:2'-5' RNA ligase
MKYSVVIVPNNKLSEEIKNFQKSFPNNDLVNVIEPHITVKRPQQVEDVEMWLEKIKVIADETSNFKITLEKVDSFGDEVVFWEPKFSEELISLHKQIFQISEKGSEGDMFENDNYHPHLTLAGTKWKISKEEVIDLKEEAVLKFKEEREFEVSFLRIYEKEEGTKKWSLYQDLNFGNK